MEVSEAFQTGKKKALEVCRKALLENQGLGGSRPAVGRQGSWRQHEVWTLGVSNFFSPTEC